MDHNLEAKGAKKKQFGVEIDQEDLAKNTRLTWPCVDQALNINYKGSPRSQKILEEHKIYI